MPSPPNYGNGSAPRDGGCAICSLKSLLHDLVSTAYATRNPSARAALLGVAAPEVVLKAAAAVTAADVRSVVVYFLSPPASLSILFHSSPRNCATHQYSPFYVLYAVANSLFCALFSPRRLAPPAPGPPTGLRGDRRRHRKCDGRHRPRRWKRTWPNEPLHRAYADAYRGSSDGRCFFLFVPLHCLLLGCGQSKRSLRKLLGGAELAQRVPLKGDASIRATGCRNASGFDVWGGGGLSPIAAKTAGFAMQI